MTGAAIEAWKLTKDLKGSFSKKAVRVLDDVSLSILRRETYGLLGPNGAGKTTTFKILLGLMRPTKGKVSVLGLEAGHPEVLKRVGFLPENPYFYSHLTGREFLDFAGQLFGIKSHERKERINQLLHLVSIQDAACLPMRKYSKGMLQRLGIAHSLINDPEIIFWDEPMSGLDPIGRKDVRMILIKLKEQGKTIFFNSHLLPDVNEVCDRVGVMHLGRLIAEESIANISSGGNYLALEEYFLTKIEEAVRVDEGKPQQ